MSRFLLVELEYGLDRSRHTGIFLSLKHVLGVRSVTDLEAISQVTLDSYLMGPTEVVVVPDLTHQLELV